LRAALAILPIERPSELRSGRLETYFQIFPFLPANYRVLI
jgi:hypothetical protein